MWKDLKIFRPYFVKDRVDLRISGLIAVTIVVPLVFLLIYILLASAASVLFWIAVGSEALVILPVLYAISSILRSKILVTSSEVMVVNGYRKKVVQLKKIKRIAYRNFSKGIVAYRVSQMMPYQAGVIVYNANGREREVELPIGWHYLQDFVRELRNILGESLSVDEASFQRWRKWYQTPLSRRTREVAIVIVVLFLWLLPPVSILVWVERSFSLNLSNFQVWLFGGLGIVVYTWFLLLVLKGIDAIRKRSE